MKSEEICSQAPVLPLILCTSGPSLPVGEMGMGVFAPDQKNLSCVREGGGYQGVSCCVITEGIFKYPHIKSPETDLRGLGRGPSKGAVQEFMRKHSWASAKRESHNPADLLTFTHRHSFSHIGLVLRANENIINLKPKLMLQTLSAPSRDQNQCDI